MTGSKRGVGLLGICWVGVVLLVAGAGSEPRWRTITLAVALLAAWAWCRASTFGRAYLAAVWVAVIALLPLLTTRPGWFLTAAVLALSAFTWVAESDHRRRSQFATR